MEKSTIAACLICLWLVRLSAFAETTAFSSPPAPAPEYRQDQILLQPRPGVAPDVLTRLHSAAKGEVVRTFAALGGLQVVRLPQDQTVPAMIARYKQSGLVAFAEPDYTGQILATAPNDPRYLDHTLWGLDRIDAPAGWDVLTSASNIVVAVLDTGVRHTHEDLAANMWVNPLDGSPGWNALTGTNNPSDDSGHGTMVAGVLGAVGNNAKGVVGVAWRIQLMAGKCFNQFGSGNVSDCITCMDYARTHGARIINASFGFTNSLALSNAVSSLRDAGIIVVAACGNSSANVDVNPVYPACYQLDNLVSVAYTTPADALAADANYGATNVDLAAPGQQIHSTFGATDNFYYTQSGSSFAAPYVAGALALIQARFPAESHQQIIARLLAGTDPLPALAGKCVTGGRLNLRKALSPPLSLTVLPAAGVGPFQLRVAGGPNRTCVIEYSTSLTNWVPAFTNTTSADGTFDYLDAQSAGQTQRFYRARSTL